MPFQTAEELERLVGFDADAWDSLSREIEVLAGREARRLELGPVECDEACAEVRDLLWREGGRRIVACRLPTAFPAYLATIVGRRLRAKLRRQRTRAWSDGAGRDATLAGGRAWELGDEAREQTSEYLATLLEAASSRLNPRHLRVLRLRISEKRTHREIGSAIGVSRDAAKKVCRRALAALVRVAKRPPAEFPRGNRPPPPTPSCRRRRRVTDHSPASRSPG